MALDPIFLVSIAITLLEDLCAALLLILPVLLVASLLWRTRYRFVIGLLTLLAVAAWPFLLTGLWIPDPLDAAEAIPGFPLFLLLGVLCALFYFARPKSWPRFVVFGFGILGLGVLVFLAGLFFGNSMVVYSLGDEDDDAAERAYWYIQDTASLDWLIHEINSPRFNESQINVKFYLARALGCDLRDLSPAAKAKILANVSREPIQVVFFASNTVNRTIGCTTRTLTPYGIAEYYSNPPDPSFIAYRR